MSNYVSFHCSACNVRLRASIRLVGRARRCPACRTEVVLEPVVPPPADPLFVLEDMPLPPEIHPGWNVLV
jgi:DNA-directed RNA polymerase subunit RPC12/RpoP